MSNQVNAPYEFAAQPRLINRPNALSLKVQQQIQYRDPYREYIKIAPQNIMYDRRVVRGNTFAALVIPVNMQPESMTSVKKPKQSVGRSQYMQGNDERQGYQNSDQVIRSSQRGDAQRNDWEELSDVSRQMDEFDVEPDFYIDMAPDAIFIPDLDGIDKQNYVDTKSIFDFELEARPVLQVLIGKALDQAQVEVIEEWELAQLMKHKAQYKQLRESELVETQRMEAANTRKNEEQDRRVLQQRTANSQTEMAQKQVLARVFVKDWMKYFKRDNLQVLIDLGNLRSQRELSMGMDFIPKLIGQAEYEIIKKSQNTDGLNDIVHTTASKIARSHKASIMKEIKRQEEAELQKKKEERDRIEATKLRKERRNALREAYSLKKLTNTFLSQVINGAQKVDYNPSVTVYDVREYHPTRENGIFVIGGFVGELVIVFTALYDYILANPANQEFRFSTDQIEKFLMDWMKEADFPEGTCVIKMKEELNFRVSDAEGNLDHQMTAMQIATALKNPATHQSFGLNFLLKHKKDVLLNDNAIIEIFSAITKVSLIETKPEKSFPPEGVENYQTLVDAVNNENEQVKQQNEAVQKLKSKISLSIPKTKYAKPEEAETWHYPEDPSNYEFWNEKCYVAIKNYKEPEGAAPVEEAKPLDKKAQLLKEAEKAKLAALAAEQDPNQEPPFELEKISNKIQLISSLNNAAQINVFVHHIDASHFIRKAIIERALKFWSKDLKDIHINQILGHCAGKSKVLEEKLIEFIEQRLEWGTGQMYEDRNIKMIFNTFLKQNDYRVDTQVLNELVAKETAAPL